MLLKPLISILLPIYRYDEFVLIAINSIITQTYTNFELVIIDDSIDNLIFSVICDIGDKRIVYVKGKNKGISSALNLGIETCSGEYIARMDADDISSKYRFEIQLSYLIKNDLDICGGNIIIFGAINQKTIFPEVDEDIKFHLLIGCPIAHPTVFAKAEVFRKFKYDEELFAGEDYDLWVRMSKGGVKFGNVQRFLLDYRIHEAQSSKIKVSHKEIVLKTVKEYSNEYLNEHDFMKFSAFGYGLNKNYSSKEFYALALLIKNISIDKNVNIFTIKRYINAMVIRINDISFYTFRIYLRIMKRFNFDLNVIILIYILVNCFITLSPLNRRFGFIRKLF